jgi:hypothetical protein
MERVQVGEFLHAHEIVRLVPHAAHNIVGFLEMLVSIPTNFILLPWNFAKFFIYLVDIIEQMIFILKEVGYNIL